MNFEYLNEMIEYIENHLTEKIEYKELAKILGVSEYSLQRIFIFLADVSLSEYIRKRRLSKAFEELKTTDIKIIDLAIKYQYDSSISFSRAFKKIFEITPSECRNSQKEYKLYPIIKFSNNKTYKELNYEINEIEEIEIYGKKIVSETHDDSSYNIRKLYKELIKKGLYKKFNEVGQYAISFHNEKEWVYIVGCEIKYNDMEKFIIPKGRYAVFNVGARDQESIRKTDKEIYSQWFPSTNYKILENIHFEVYIGDNCYIYIPIEKGKQN